MLDADAAVPAKMVSVLLRSISINQPSAATDASASMSPASSTSSAASSFVTSSLSSTSVSSGHALQVLMHAGTKTRILHFEHGPAVWWLFAF